MSRALPLPLIVSILVHLSAVAAAGGFLRMSHRGPSAEGPTIVTIDVATEAAATNTPGAPAVAASSGPAAAARPAPRKVRRPTAARPVMAPPTAAEAPRFALGAVKTSTAPAIASTAPAPSSGAAASWQGGDIAAESGVSVPARPLADVPIAYPARARAAEVEADVPLEIVVDERGQVRQARLLSRSGYGLDESALQAIWRFRFSPALRGGRPVPVRMHWLVHFRLR